MLDARLPSGYAIRRSRTDDLDAVAALLRASYPPLLDGAYDPDVLTAATPALVRANPALLSCETWYVVDWLADETSQGGSAVVACGGFTPERPDTGEVEPGLAHLRHFATHPEHLRRGLAAALVRRSFSDAREMGLREFEAYSTLTAEPFYAALGLRRIRRFDLQIPILDRPGETVPFPAVQMRGPVPGLSR